MHKEHDVRRLRRALGLSQYEFGAAVGRTGEMICRIETGRNRPGPEVIERALAKWPRECLQLGITAATLMEKLERQPREPRSPSLVAEEAAAS